MRKKMSKPAPEPEVERLDKRLQLVLSAGFLKRLDRWRATQPDMPNRSRAIREAMERIFRESR
jgi:hypothetical protein